MPGIYVEQYDEDLLSVKMPYFKPYIKRIRSVDGARWDEAEGHWTVPIESAEDLDDAFEDELIYALDRNELLDLPDEPVPAIYKKIKKKSVKDLKMPLRPFQQFGVNFLSYSLKRKGIALLGDLMGAGKTFSAIATSMQMKQEGLVEKCLVVVLASTRAQWMSEIAKFTNEKAVMFGEFKAKYRQKDGKKYIAETVDQQKNKLIDEFLASDAFFMVMSYQTLQQNADMLERVGFDMMVSDEAHTMKNRTSLTNKAAKKLVTKRTKRSKYGEYGGIPYVLFTTGTPIMNYPDEIYGLVGIVGEKVFGKWRDFRAEYCVLNEYKDVIGYRNLSKLRKTMQMFMMRRTDKELGIDLPKIMEEDIWIEPHPKQVKMDKALLKEQAELLMKRNNKAAKAGDEKAMIIEQRLKGIKNARIAASCHPNAFQLATNEKLRNKWNAYYVKDLYEIPKFERCINIIEEAVNNKHKVVVFVNSKRMTKIFEKEINKFTQCVRYIGGLSDKEREARKTEFNQNPRCMVIICNNAGSTGINLQAGRYLINYDLPHNPAEWEQRKYRIRRMDSKHDKIYIINLLNKGLVDEKMRGDLSTKQSSFNGTLENTSAVSKFHEEMNR